jgi:hypothetical protein
MRAAPREDSGLSAAEAVYGSPLVLPGQLVTASENFPPDKFYTDLRDTMAGFVPPAILHNTNPDAQPAPELPAALAQAEFVLVRKDGHKPPLAPVYEGPYRVLARSVRVFKLQIGTREETVSTLRLKAAFMPANAIPAVPPRRGRPPILRQRAAPPAARPARHVRFAAAPAVISAPSSDRPTRQRNTPARFADYVS